MGENITEYLDVSEATVTECVLTGSDMSLTLNRVRVSPGCGINSTHTPLCYEKFGITLKNVSLRNAAEAARRVIGSKGVKEIKQKKLYKSEFPDFMARLAAEGWEMFLLTAAPEKDGLKVLTELVFPESEPFGAYYEAEFVCNEISAGPLCEGVPVKEKKLTLSERAVKLTRDIPALFIAMGHKDTPLGAKLLAGLAAAYAMSPVDLIPDAIPLIGQLDDLIIVPLLVSAALSMIPPGVMAECRKKAAGRGSLPKKRFYAIPIIIVWIIIAALIVNALLKLVLG